MTWARPPALVNAVLIASQAIPVFALAPLLVLWLGYGIASKVAMAALIIFFPVTAAFLEGLARRSSIAGRGADIGRERCGPALADPGSCRPARARIGLKSPQPLPRSGLLSANGFARPPTLAFDAACQRADADRPRLRGGRRPRRTRRCALFPRQLAAQPPTALGPKTVSSHLDRYDKGTDMRLLTAFTAAAISLATALPANAEKLTVMLDWFINPDHAPPIVAEERESSRNMALTPT